MRKSWQKPKLIVLVRGKLEEYVLSACKTAGGSGPAPSHADCLANSDICPPMCESDGS